MRLVRGWIWGCGGRKFDWSRSAASACETVRRIGSISSTHQPSPPTQSQPKWDVVLYKYEACPFSWKVRTWLDFHRFPYRTVEVDPFTKKEIAFSKEYKKVPIVVLDQNRQINDSSIILRELHEEAVRREWITGRDALHVPYASQKTQFIDVEQALHDEAWLTWADQKLVKLLPVNIYRNFSEAFEAFEYIGKVGQWSFLRRHALRYTGAFAMRMLHDKLRTRAGLEKGADEREALFAQLELWADAIGRKQFSGGETPSLSDLVVFSYLRSVESLQTGRDALRSNSCVAAWYQRMVASIPSSSRE